MYVFVYGTLKSDGPLHPRMSGAKLIGPAETVNRDYLMIDLGGYYPGVVEGPNGTTIKGELFEGDDELLATLDRVEGVPRLFTRKLLPVACNGENYLAWIYLYNYTPGRTYKFRTTGEWNNE